MLNVDDRRCGNCAHANQKGQTKHYRRWLVTCGVAEISTVRATKLFDGIKGLPLSVSGPQPCDMDRDEDATNCPCWQKGDRDYGR